MARDLEPGGKVLRVRRLGGGLSGLTSAVDIRLPDGAVRKLVLKRYAPGDPLVEREWIGLLTARAVELPSPEPVALDAAGAWFGTPALVMRRVTGRPDIAGIRADARLNQLARVLALLHNTPAPTGLQDSIPIQPAYVWARPARATRSRLLNRAYEAIEQIRAAEVEPDLIHGDVHPGNLLWSRGRLAAIVDWAGCGLGPRAFELAHCRADLTLLFGWRTADRFLEHYLSYARRAPTDLALWDLYCGLMALQHFRAWMVAYSEQGVAGLQVPGIRARLLAFVARAELLLAQAA